MVKTYCKTIRRMFKKHVIRLISLTAIMLISVGFISGIGSPSDMIKDSITKYYKSQNVSDFIVKSKTTGFSAEQIEKIKEAFGAENIATGLSIDISTGEKRSLRLYFIDLDNWTINKAEQTEENFTYPTDERIAYAEAADNIIKGYTVGDKVHIDLGKELNLPISINIDVEIGGIVKSPLTFGKDGEPSYNNPEDIEIPDNVAEINKLDVLENILYCSKKLLPSYIPQGDIYITLENRNLFDAFSNEYGDYVEQQKSKITDILGEDIRIITLYDNYSFKSICATADKVRGIGNILMIIFLFVTVLVVLSSMTRLMEEERPQIACFATLGYKSSSIVIRYLIFALVALLIGGCLGFFVGYGVSWLICSIFDYSHAMPPISVVVNPSYYFVSFAVITCYTIATILILGLRMINESPASLLRPKSPKNGKSTLLERIPFVWKRLSFKYKSSFRNVFRYKSRFFMMLISVAVSTGLVFAGLALLDMCLFTDFGSASIIGIAVVVIAFSALLTTIVINVLTTINISERNREIATLMVLGYHDGEVCGYIYREIFINTVIGILFGFPVGIGFSALIFNTIGFGSIGDINWFMWLLAPVAVIIFTGLVMLMLRPKIVKVKMNESLKAIE